jgi:hypothetical protein
VQFADFGYRLLRGAHEIYTSPTGQRTKHVDLSVVFTNLSRITTEVKLQLSVIDGLGATQLDQTTSSLPSTDVFLRLAREYEDTSKALHAIFSKLSDQEGKKVSLVKKT